MVVKKGESGHTGGGGQRSRGLHPATRHAAVPARFCRVFQGFGPPGDLRGPFLILFALRKLRPTTSIIIESLLNHYWFMVVRYSINENS